LCLQLLTLPVRHIGTSTAKIDEMIKMVDKDGDGQVGRIEFFRLVTGGNNPPPGFMNLNKTQSGNGQKELQARKDKRKMLDDFAREQHFKPETIKYAHRRFEATDRHSTGKINYTQFCDILKVEPSPQCRSLFGLYDYDENGMMNGKEMLVALANSVGAKKEDKMRFVFQIYGDSDGDTGSISKADLIQVLKANHGARVEREVMKKADTIMDRVDKNGTGLLSFDDFVTVSKQFPNILFPEIQRG
jgi:serine/threonine-protein phosphatase 2B regulatory subunit